MSGEILLCCPNCGSSRLATREMLLGDAECEVHVQGDGNDFEVEGLGETTVNWDSSTTIGGCCLDCGWELMDADAKTEGMDEWTDALVEEKRDDG